MVRAAVDPRTWCSSLRWVTYEQAQARGTPIMRLGVSLLGQRGRRTQMG